MTLSTKIRLILIKYFAFVFKQQSNNKAVEASTTLISIDFAATFSHAAEAIFDKLLSKEEELAMILAVIELCSCP